MGLNRKRYKKRKRGALITCAIVLLSCAVILVMFALRDTVVFFYSPSEILAQDIEAGKRFRIGGLVVEGSIQKGDGTKMAFLVTDTKEKFEVRYDGLLPDLFREGQGIVAEGALTEEGWFNADTVLAKHDENYMPPEVADALKKQSVNLNGASHPGL